MTSAGSAHRADLPTTASYDEVLGQDLYGRTVPDVIVNGQNVAEIMVAEGHDRHPPFESGGKGVRRPADALGQRLSPSPL